MKHVNVSVNGTIADARKLGVVSVETDQGFLNDPIVILSEKNMLKIICALDRIPTKETMEQFANMLKDAASSHEITSAVYLDMLQGEIDRMIFFEDCAEMIEENSKRL